MAITYHKAVAYTGGAKGAELSSGVVNELLPEISLSQQTSGITISRKFYIANSSASDVAISALSFDNYTVFPGILFESGSDAEVAGDLSGSETDESPITVTIPASGNKSFWVQVDVPAGSTETGNYNKVDVKTIF